MHTLPKRMDLQTVKTNPTEIYGFVLWITSFIVYVITLMWALVPNEYLHQLGITYYPDK